MSSIFLVEDDHRIRSLLVQGLAERGHAVRAESRALDALREIVEWKPDVVVLDLGLPDLDGSDALKMLRALAGWWWRTPAPDSPAPTCRSGATAAGVRPASA
ncbi:MAG: response regulator transcription factor, partial [Acidimicrobiia bacterium]